MTLGFGLVVAGIVLVFGSFIFAAGNMLTGVAQDRQFGSVFGGHLGAMIGMAVGMMIGTIGLVIVGIDLYHKFVG